jgi:hypothetical protein
MKHKTAISSSMSNHSYDPKTMVWPHLIFSSLFLTTELQLGIKRKHTNASCRVATNGHQNDAAAGIIR